MALLHLPSGLLSSRAARRSPTIEPEEFERHLLRRTVDILTETRTTCADCDRTPLVGEQLHLFEAGELVCELCSQLRREQPIRSIDVRHSAYGQTVRVSRTA
ncbi:MAG: hypothetical protein ACR2KV_11600 [Solirubrobacteraceae bacterium]